MRSKISVDGSVLIIVISKGIRCFMFLLSCDSVRADSSSQNTKGNHSGKSDGFLHQNAGSDWRQEPLHNDRNTRCKISYRTTLADYEHKNKRIFRILPILLLAGSSEKLPSDQLIGNLVKSDNKQLELHLCKIVRRIICICDEPTLVKWCKGTNIVPFLNVGEASKHCFPHWSRGEVLWTKQQQRS